MQDGLGIVPCELCLLERWPFRALALLGIAALLLPRRATPLLWLAAATLTVSAGLGFLHAGVEWGWWPSPFPSCRAPVLGGGDIAARLAAMPARPQKPCDAPTDLIPRVPVSMAAMNAAGSLSLAAILAIWLVRHSADGRR